MRIQVTQDNIVAGARSDQVACPVALAIQDVIGIEALVGTNMISYGYGMYVDTPATVRDFIVAFDKGADVAPFTFDLSETP